MPYMFTCYGFLVQVTEPHIKRILDGSHMQIQTKAFKLGNGYDESYWGP